ncbi:hypothetical protein [Halopiger djelfimassiliensis]|uniref:hypothetical protein n=1 Tax=Halopiger djelfimassiliensis TaxID=1293047 RepID=UPI001E2EB12D|nr:hypothetical protein [Halopiger djelfimassiliensis]
MSNRGIEVTDREGTAINWRQSNGGVTLYEADNPDAWITMEFEAGVPPEHRLYMICDECGSVFAQRSKPGNGTVCGDCGTTFEHDR